MKARASLPLGAIFGFPTAIALVTIAGLVSALLDDGLVDAVSWVALSVPVAVAARSWWKRER
ncbi:membrane protein [Azospirillum thiophilum]|uniref:Uncharacterized protein n=1 Tax=Azospirillum thiophilum TaxID=528244 RepID=A0AAC8VZX0_9PROT|nr:hypothetical protein [Azospirillum thiophilum]ALG72523.1 hypothetical protein AL072_15675 [Azospirillum thiophilum]KJR64560.1 membrane protein [Azospirillum thiophilum]